MTTTATISTEVDIQLKEQAEQIFSELGLTVTQAITLFYKQVELQRGLPFEVKLPEQTINKTKKQKLETITENVFQRRESAYTQLAEGAE